MRGSSACPGHLGGSDLVRDPTYADPPHLTLAQLQPLAEQHFRKGGRTSLREAEQLHGQARTCTLLTGFGASINSVRKIRRGQRVNLREAPQKKSVTDV